MLEAHLPAFGHGRIRYLGDTSNFAPSPAGEGWNEGD
jgi:hypothetical protein